MKNRTIKTGILDSVESLDRDILTDVIRQGFDAPVITPVTIDRLELELRLSEAPPIEIYTAGPSWMRGTPNPYTGTPAP